MRNIQFVIVFLLLLIHSGICRADLPVVLTKDTKTFVNLMDTDLVKKKNLLDCELRLVGKAPHYKLIYSLGEIEVPTLAVKEEIDHAFAYLAVKATINKLPVSTIFIRYQADISKPYKMELNCFMSPCYAPVAYVMTLDRSEQQVYSVLRSRYAKELIDDSRSNTGVDHGAIMIRDRPHVETPSPDGLGGSDDIHKTELHYVCSTEQ